MKKSALAEYYGTYGPIWTTPFGFMHELLKDGVHAVTPMEPGKYWTSGHEEGSIWVRGFWAGRGC